MQWNLRMKAAERGIWKSVELRRLLAEAGLDISAGKMSMLWTTTPTTIRLEDLDVICAVLECTPAELLITDPAAVTARRQAAAAAVGEVGDPASGKQAATRSAKPTPRLGRNRTLPPA
ncbi:helix-turn-helix transcriptional regulator [Sporichthya sp.]|uniref:helix-turn-helix domain-containing protein n=1 Tax=Sporichthya sp. TaxID=65475 RepID=UPI0017EB0E96|nr:helix-turn-helix transcriptional regulator [Sporichthya sp.]MBA3745669.1 helix-turn-helix transcriptional regulator [Sporichthya sp.]